MNTLLRIGIRSQIYFGIESRVTMFFMLTMEHLVASRSTVPAIECDVGKGLSNYLLIMLRVKWSVADACFNYGLNEEIQDHEPTKRYIVSSFARCMHLDGLLCLKRC